MKALHAVLTQKESLSSAKVFLVGII